MKRYKFKILIFSLVILIIAGFTAAWLITRPADRKTAPGQSAHNRISPTLTAGGIPVPAAWQAKAKALGYYCPSWNSQPGQVSSGVCVTLDKH